MNFILRRLPGLPAASLPSVPPGYYRAECKAGKRELNDGSTATRRNWPPRVPRLATCKGFVFAGLDRNAPDFEPPDPTLRCIDKVVDWAHGGEVAVTGSVHRYEYRSNWRAQFENILGMSTAVGRCISSGVLPAIAPDRLHQCRRFQPREQPTLSFPTPRIGQSYGADRLVRSVSIRLVLHPHDPPECFRVGRPLCGLHIRVVAHKKPSPSLASPSPSHDKAPVCEHDENLILSELQSPPIQKDPTATGQRWHHRVVPHSDQGALRVIEAPLLKPYPAVPPKSRGLLFR